MITDALIQYVESKLLNNIDDYTLTDTTGSIKDIQRAYRSDYGKDISYILVGDIIHILKLKYNNNRRLREKVVIDDNVLRSYPG